MSKKIICEKDECENEQLEEDMKNNISNVLLCDGCYTELRHLIADYLDVNIFELHI